MEKQKEITLTKKQFLTLLKTVYLGNWLANAIRTGRPDDKHIKEYEDMEDYIFSFAKQFGYTKYVHEDDAYKGKYFPTRDFEEDLNLHELIQEYDEESFWEELPDRLGQRDFHRKYTSREISNMNQEERFTKLCECIEEWQEEIYKNGLENISIKN